MKFEFIVVQAIGVLIEVIVTYSYFEALLSPVVNLQVLL